MKLTTSGNTWMALLGLAILYYAAARLGLVLAFPGSNASPVWPPSGLALAALALRGTIMLPGIALGAFAANALSFASQGVAPTTYIGVSLLITAGNSLEAWFALWLLRRAVRQSNPFERLDDVAKFIAIAALASMAAAAVGTTALVLGGVVPKSAAATVSLTWWIGDATGILVVAPLLMAVAQRGLRLPAAGTSLAFAAALAALVVLGAGVFGLLDGIGSLDRRMTWLFMPCIAWMAFRHGALGVAAASLITAAIAVWGTTRGLGPFARGDLNDSLIVLQTFVGLVAITGLILAADRRERQQMGRQGKVRRDLAVPWAVLLSSLGVTVAGWHMVASDTEARAGERFEVAATAVHDRITTTMQETAQILRGASGLFAASDDVTRGEWRAYVDRLQLAKFFPGVQAVGFARELQPATVDQHVQRVRDGGFPDFAVRPTGRRTSYAVITYIEPFDSRNKRAFGFDLHSDPVRHAAVAEARDSGLPTMSGKVTLLQEDGQDVQAGALLFQAIYRNGAEIQSVEQRRANLVGYVYTPLRMNNLIRSALGQTAEQEGVATRLYSGKLKDARNLLFDSGGQSESKKRFAAVRSVALGGVSWSLEVTSQPRFESGIDLQKAQIILVAGVGLSLLLFALVRALTLTRERALMLAEDMNIAVKDSQAQFRSLAESASEAIIILDAHGRICSWNRAAEAIFGRSEQEMLGGDLARVMPARYRDAHYQGMARMRSGGTARVVGRTVQLEGLRSDGTEFPIELSLSTWESAAGRFYSGIIRDITDRARAAEALRQSERSARAAESQLQAVLSASPLGIIFTDAHGKLVYGNPTYLAIAGISIDQAHGDGWTRAIHPDDRPKVAQEWKKATALGGLYEVEFRYAHADGSVVWARAVRAPVVQEGVAKGFVAAVEDVTARVMADTQLDAKTRALERSNEELAQYAYVASHDLKEPLRAVVSYSQLLKRRYASGLDPAALEFISLIDEGARRAQALVSDLLSLARVDSSGDNLQPVELQDVVKDALRQLAESLREADAQVTVGPLPRVLGDQQQLAQLLQNLIENAIKFHRHGQRPSVQIAGQPDDPGFCRISVADNGIGMAPRYLDQIFTIFKRLHRAEFPGTGIGLAICKKVVDRHGGRIWVESEPGQGSTFCFTMPLASTEKRDA